VGYIKGPEVEAQDRARIACLQNAFIEHLDPSSRPVRAETGASQSPSSVALPAGPATTVFGFDCSDPLAGLAPGTHRGELCTHFLGCFTCPNAVIPPNPATLARLLQAREHLQRAAETVHPARWEALYAPPLRILEHDLLPRFAARELAAAEPLRACLPALPELR
jgi:hypothetical protein